MNKLPYSLRLAALFAALTAASGTAAAQNMYKWVDDQGNIQYTQTPPHQGDAQKVAPPPKPAVSPEEAKRQMEKYQEALQPPDPGKAKSQAEEKSLADTRKQNCETARKNLALYENPNNRRFRRPDGTVTIPTEQERKSRQEEAKKQIKEWCDENGGGDAVSGDKNKPAGTR